MQVGPKLYNHILGGITLRMELFATGFNAWSQLKFEEQESCTENPDDIQIFVKVLSASFIAQPYASLSCTVVRTTTGILSAGYPDLLLQHHDIRDKLLTSSAAIAGNGVVVVFDGDQCIHQYESANHYQASKVLYSFSGLSDIVQLLAYETGFVALSADGRVWTWGDGRYGACLGRDVSEISPADQPCCVTDLDDLPTGRIRMLAAGGYLLMALTEGHDLYAWGGHPGRPAIIEELSGSPSPVVVEEKDITDCAVGESHAIVLTSDGDIYAIGDNTNGQLGIPDGKVASWNKILLNSKAGSSVSAVVCGPRSSFALVRNNTDAS
ncbi:regulator of chromosome condensation 1/beta-lactamase-inhibitor protein II [Xylariales sp. AK1849]|nr:regulator of chromosome condensation 1/beta-lactamase-inhibitor protein II [Xylariales sp. AK1849]